MPGQTLALPAAGIAGPTLAILLTAQAAFALPARVCNRAELGLVPFELCEAARLADEASALRVTAAGIEMTAPRVGPGCGRADADGAGSADCRLSDASARKADGLRRTADEKDAEAERHRALAEEIRQKVRARAK